MTIRRRTRDAVARPWVAREDLAFAAELPELGPRRWTPRLALEGSAHVDDALAAGRGAVLWVAHFCFSALATKKALAGTGHRAWHVSRRRVARHRARARRKQAAAARRQFVEPPITVARDADVALDVAAQAFAMRLDDYVRRYPAQWRDWKSLKRYNQA